MRTTWKAMLKGEFDGNGDDFSKMICTLTEKELCREFNNGPGVTEGSPFLAWGENFVYFPVQHDGQEWVGSVPRNPRNEPANHFGGH